MQQFVKILVIGIVVSMGMGGAQAAFEMNPMVQDMVKHHIAQVQEWAADPVIVKAVSEQNAQGPIAGMDNRKWKGLRRRDPLMKSFRSNQAAGFLRAKQAASKGMISQLILSAAQGEKVAFTNKPTAYLSIGEPAFDKPFDSGKVWKGEPTFDMSIQTHVLLISVPVLVDGKPAGVLVMAIQLGHMEKMSKMNMKH